MGCVYQRKDGKQLVSIRLPPDLVTEIKVYAIRNRTTLGGFIERAARAALEQQTAPISEKVGKRA